MNWMRTWRVATAGGLVLLLAGAAAAGVGSRPEDVSEVVAPHPVPPTSGAIQPDLLLFCGETPLTVMLSGPVPATQDPPTISVVLATARLTSTRAAEPGGSPVYQKMVLDSVRTLAGPPVPSGSVGWINARSYYDAELPLDRQPRYQDDLGSMWGPDGRMFAFFEWEGGAVGPKLVTAPVVGGDVVFSQAGCWNADGLPSRPYRGPVAEVPGSHTYELATQSPSGLRAVPLAAVVALATGGS